MTKNNISRFWECWLVGETRESLIEWLESQGVFVAMGVDNSEVSKYSLKELFWATLDKKYTGLPVDLRLDEIGSQRTPKLIHFSEPLLTFQNSYDGRIYENVLPMSISKNPKVLEDEEYIHIKPEDVEAVRQFIIKHYDLLMKHWRHEIDTMELHHALESSDKTDFKASNNNLKEKE